MKKYIITEAMLNTLQSLAMPRHLAEALDELNPIEPLSDREISQLWSDAHNDTSDRMAHQVLSRAIERHIIGSETP